MKSPSMPETNPEPPRKVVLFSGHMIDAPGREKPRFPPDREPIAAAAIAAALADLGLGPNDLAICGGACGGDLLFAEAARARGARLELYIPFEEPRFSRSRSISPGATGAGAISRRRRAPRFMSRPASLARRKRARTRTSATTAGC